MTEQSLKNTLKPLCSVPPHSLLCGISFSATHTVQYAVMQCKTLASKTRQTAQYSTEHFLIQPRRSVN